MALSDAVADIGRQDYETNCTVYVGGVHANISGQALFEAFKQFGKSSLLPLVWLVAANMFLQVMLSVTLFASPSSVSTENLVSSMLSSSTPLRRRPTMLYLLGVWKFLVTTCLSLLSMLVTPRKQTEILPRNIKPRDRKQDHRVFKHGSQGSSGYKSSHGEFDIKPINKDLNGATRGPIPALMTTVLELDNLPHDMPMDVMKQILDKEAEGTNGVCIGVYFMGYPNPDTGNKFGLASMSGYYTAQKVSDNLPVQLFFLRIDCSTSSRRASMLVSLETTSCASASALRPFLHLVSPATLRVSPFRITSRILLTS